jgi:hypothetical protein
MLWKHVEKELIGTYGKNLKAMHFQFVSKHPMLEGKAKPTQKDLEKLCKLLWH